MALAAVGLYGVIGFSVTVRRREFGIRMALGAPAARLRLLVLWQTGMLTLAGLLLGAGGAAALLQVLKHRLVGVHPSDPVAWSVAAAGLVLVALLASLIPVRRATRVDVTETLRTV